MTKQRFSILLPLIICLSCNAQQDNRGVVENLLECPKLSKDVDNNVVIIKYDPENIYGINYFLEYNLEKRSQRFTAYKMYKGNSGRNLKRTDFWHEEQSINPKYRTTQADYRGSGYSRGHILPSHDRLVSAEMNKQTFCYSNIMPQLSKFNSGIWLKMENKVTSWNRDNFRDTLYVVKGGTIDKSEHIKEYTKTGLIVPKYFFMAVLCLKNGEYKAMGFWVEHKEINPNSDLKLYAKSISELEKLTGLDFFPNLPNSVERKIEKSLRLNEWGIK